MLLNFLIEVQESKFNGKNCFVVIAAKHSTKNLEVGATKIGTANGDKPNYRYIDAVADYANNKDRNDTALVSSNISVFFFDDKNRDDVFNKSVAKACFWLMDMNINKGVNEAITKLSQLERLGGKRPYEGFSSFIGTKTNKISHKVVVDTINKMVSSEQLRDSVLNRVLQNKDKGERLVMLDTSSKSASQRTIEDMIAVSLFIAPIKTQDMSKTIGWFNNNYQSEYRKDGLTWDDEYQSLIVDVGRSICKTIKGLDLSDDIENLFAEVDVDDSIRTMDKLEKAVWLCSASELLWMAIVKSENP